jgi:hypothetical protein
MACTQVFYVFLYGVYCTSEMSLSWIGISCGSLCLEVEYEHFFQTFGHRFIAGDDYNEKNTYWDARTTTTKGR